MSCLKFYQLILNQRYLTSYTEMQLKLLKSYKIKIRDFMETISLSLSPCELRTAQFLRKKVPLRKKSSSYSKAVSNVKDKKSTTLKEQFLERQTSSSREIELSPMLQRAIATFLNSRQVSLSKFWTSLRT